MTIAPTLLLAFATLNVTAQRSYATWAGGDLYAVDVANCTSQFVGSTGIGFGDMALTPNGSLYGCVNGELWEIDTATASVTYVTAFSPAGVTLVALNDTVLLYEVGGELFGVSLPSGSTWLIGNIGQGSPGDLTWFNNELYMTGNGLVRITLNANATAITAVAALNSNDPNFPGCEAMITAYLAPDAQCLVGFSGPDAYAYCHLDGTYALLCPGILWGGTPGAACPRLPPPPPVQVGCADPLTVHTIAANAAGAIVSNLLVVGEPLILQASRSGLLGLRLYAVSGSLVAVQESSGSSLSLPTGELSPGLYIARPTVDGIAINPIVIVMQ